MATASNAARRVLNRIPVRPETARKKKSRRQEQNMELFCLQIRPRRTSRRGSETLVRRFPVKLVQVECDRSEVAVSLGSHCGFKDT